MADDKARALATLDFLEAAYAWSLPDEEWVMGVVNSACRLWGDPQWAYGLFYDASDVSRVRVLLLKSLGLPTRFDAMLRPFIEAMPPEISVPLYRSTPVGFGSALGAHTPDVEQALREVGSTDIFGINGLDPNGLGFVVCMGTRRTHLEKDEGILFDRLAAHLASAHRCRRRLRASTQPTIDEAEVVLDPNGRILDASGPGRSPVARKAV